MKKSFLITTIKISLIAIVLSGCNNTTVTKQIYPETREEINKDEIGQLWNNDIVVFDNQETNKAQIKNIKIPNTQDIQKENIQKENIQKKDHYK